MFFRTMYVNTGRGVYTDMSCNGSESSVQECTWSSGTCDRNRLASLRCMRNSDTYSKLYSIIETCFTKMIEAIQLVWFRFNRETCGLLLSFVHPEEKWSKLKQIDYFANSIIRVFADNVYVYARKCW